MIDLSDTVAKAQLATAILFLALALFLNFFAKIERRSKEEKK